MCVAPALALTLKCCLGCMCSAAEPCNSDEEAELMHREAIDRFYRATTTNMGGVTNERRMNFYGYDPTVREAVDIFGASRALELRRQNFAPVQDPVLPPSQNALAMARPQGQPAQSPRITFAMVEAHDTFMNDFSRPSVLQRPPPLAQPLAPPRAAAASAPTPMPANEPVAMHERPDRPPPDGFPHWDALNGEWCDEMPSLCGR